MNHVAEDIQRQGMLPIVYAGNFLQAVGAAKALAEENMKIVEFPWDDKITLRILEDVGKECQGIRFGCSHILDPRQAKEAASVSAQFLVVSALNRETIACGRELGLTVFPVAGTLDEIEAAINQGFDRICIEPVTFLGGPELFYELKRKYSGIRFMPRGGITTETAEDYLSFSNVFACGGDWLAPERLMAMSSWDDIRTKAADAMYAMLGFRILSIDFTASAEPAYTALWFPEMFRLKESIVFTEETFPANACVRITVSTNHIKRSVAYLQSKGCKLLVDEAPKNAKGGYPYIYLEDTINGTCIRLFQKNSREDG